MKRTKPIIGIVGSIGAGKTTVARLLAEMGAAVIDSDQQAHEVLETEEVRRTLRQWWGANVCPDGARTDRAAIARIVFSSPDELRRLEGLLYPRIAEKRDAMLAQLETAPQVAGIVLDSPKLFEAGLDALCDAVIMVDVDPKTRAARLAASRGWNAADVERRQNQQISVDEKRAKADYVVVNDSDLDALRLTIKRLWETILDDFAKHSVRRHHP